MNTIPIAFAFDNNLVMPACVCLSSLMMNAKPDTFYDIFILHSEKEQLKKEELDKLPSLFPNCRIQYRTVGDAFSDGFEIRGITKATYYRLLIPQIIPEYNKIFYADVDIIFRMDLSSIYETDITDSYVAATYDLGMILTQDGQKHIEEIGLKHKDQYMQAGFLLFNSKKMREEDMARTFLALYKKNFKFQDQDILNIACHQAHTLLPLKCNMTDYVHMFLEQGHPYFSKYTQTEIAEGLAVGTLHYNGHKPWVKYALNFDIWWEYYRKSPYFDEKFYFEFFYKKLDEYDRLPLWKRIKILARYFFIGQIK